MEKPGDIFNLLDIKSFSKNPQKIDAKRESLSKNSKKHLSQPIPSFPENFDCKFSHEPEKSSILENSIKALTNITNIYSVILKQKTNIEDFSHTRQDISLMKQENIILKKNLFDMEEEYKALNLEYQDDIKENSEREKDLQNKLEKYKFEYYNCINQLKNRNEALNKIYNIYTECLHVSIKKDDDKYVCKVIKDSDDIVFSFKTKLNYTTYTPINVHFPAGSFLNYQIEDLNKNELSLLFSRFLKIIHNN